MAEDDIVFPVPRNDELRKARELIYTYSTTEKLTLVMRKALNVMLQGAMEQGLDQEWYRIPITKLVKNIEFGSHDHKYLEETLERMQTTLIRWTSAEASEIVKDTVQLVGRTRIVGEKGATGKYVQKELRYKFDEEIKKRLLNPSVYARIDMAVMARFKSAQSLALYEQMNEVKLNRAPAADGWSYSDILPWRQWRDLLVGGVTDDGTASYSEAIKYFNRDVVRKALAELKHVAPELEIEQLTFKEGRAISSMQFRVRQKPQCQQALALQEDDGPPIDTGVLSLGLEELEFTPRDIAQIVCRYDAAHIENTLTLTRTRIARTDLPPLDSPIAYFRKMLANPPKPSATATVKKKAGAAAPSSPKAPERPRKTGPSEVELLFATFAEDEKLRLQQHWRQSEAGAYPRKEYDKHGISRPIARKAFFAWLEKHLAAP